jgi:hypothetical protein
MMGGDRKSGTSHMTSGCKRVLKAAAKTAENSVQCPGI